jgi:hypothetical protein
MSFRKFQAGRPSRVLVLVGLLAGLASVASAAQVKGFLMDVHCSSQARERLVPGGQLVGGVITAEAHTRACDLKPECQRSGYGVFTYDEKFIKLDAAGNRKALAALKASKKLDDIQVEVTGVLKGDTIKVESLKLL